MEVREAGNGWRLHYPNGKVSDAGDIRNGVVTVVKLVY